jgi:hypothetical protein
VQHDPSAAALSLSAPLHIRAPSSVSHLPQDSQSFFPFFHSDQPAMASDLQRHLSKLATKTDLKTAAREGRRYHEPRTLIAHQKTITAHDASVWKTVQPISSQHVLADAHYRLSARLNLLLPPFPGHVPASCLSCNTVGALQRDPWHYLSCIHYRRKEITLRHNTVMKALYSHAILAGGAATLEPHGLSPAGRLRPDMQILFPGQHILTDVVISHPLCPSHLARASTGSCRVADNEAFKKSDKYAEVTQYQEGARFVPFAIETTGGMGKDARALVEQISLACRDHLTLQTHASIARGLRAAIAIAVQRGNGLAMQAGRSRALGRGSAVAA